ncbi:hypothetical protein NP493_79g03062 [Ridgeia piscesae]|uniref:Lipid droplet-regulating VLDL assembly factor AUP1 n=1 Tax=Ridgeia piscesae TaxID=27915 RepID=A0AAD9UIB8_RIDPI|nr:hypothetical protein NP493_79g03062 [Ridgeia piscesae]
MTSTSIGELFHNERFPSGPALVLLMLYLPVGVILAVLRLFIGLHTFFVACILPKPSLFRHVVLRTMCGILGVIITREGVSNVHRRAKVLVANYTSTLDHLAIDLIMPNVLPSVWDLPPTLMWMLGYKDMEAKRGRDRLIQNAKKHIQYSPLPLLSFPEGASTNGRVGLLKFSVWPFSMDCPVQPVVVKVKRPRFANISPSILGGRWWIDIFWFLFVPFTHFHIRVLPPMSQDEDETVEEFAQRVQQTMAKALNIEATAHTSSDKVEYAKQILFIQPQTAAGQSSQYSPDSPPGGSSSSDLMIRQVQEVLPHVPQDAIRKDLALTKDIDLTITNILEGRVQFSPVAPSVNEPVTVSPAKTTVKSTERLSSPIQVASKTFQRSSQQRHLSLQDRKKLLIDAARQRYLEKHCGNI